MKIQPWQYCAAVQRRHAGTDRLGDDAVIIAFEAQECLERRARARNWWPTPSREAA